MTSSAACSPAIPAGGTAAGEAIVDWYATAARDLPWRRPGTDAWAVLVSEVMLQQTPVVRVEPVWQDWLARWPTPAALAAASPADVIRAWGKLGYPRRALRLREAAQAIVERHGGVGPGDVAPLEGVPRRRPPTRRGGAAPRRRPLPRAGGCLLRLRAAAARRRHQRAARRRPAGARTGGGRERPRGRPRRHRRARPARRGPRGPLLGGGHGTRCPGLHRGHPTLCRLPGARPLRLAPGGLPGTRRATPAGAEVHGHRPAGARAAPRRPARRPRARRRRAPGLRVGRRRPAEPVPGLPAGGRPRRADPGRPVHPASALIIGGSVIADGVGG